MTNDRAAAPKTAHRRSREELTPGQLRALAATYVHPGQIRASSAANPFITILGSCVAVCLHDAAAQVGGLNHFLLPQAPGSTTRETAPRYAPSAIVQLIDQVESQGGSRRRLTARIIGGASVLAAMDHKEHLGHRNVAAAHQLLAKHGIAVTRIDVGGTRGRKLIFFPQDGSIVIQLLGGWA